MGTHRQPSSEQCLTSPPSVHFPHQGTQSPENKMIISMNMMIFKSSINTVLCLHPRSSNGEVGESWGELETVGRTTLDEDWRLLQRVWSTWYISYMFILLIFIIIINIVIID